MRANLWAGAVLCVGMVLAMTGCKGMLVNVEDTEQKSSAGAAKPDLKARVSSLESRMLTLETTVHAMQQADAEKK